MKDKKEKNVVDLFKESIFEEMLSTPEDLIVIRGGNKKPLTCGNGCGLGCGDGCGAGCSGC